MKKSLNNRSHNYKNNNQLESESFVYCEEKTNTDVCEENPQEIQIKTEYLIINSHNIINEDSLEVKFDSTTPSDSGDLDLQAFSISDNDIYILDNTNIPLTRFHRNISNDKNGEEDNSSKINDHSGYTKEECDGIIFNGNKSNKEKSIQILKMDHDYFHTGASVNVQNDMVDELLYLQASSPPCEQTSTTLYNIQNIPSPNPQVTIYPLNSSNPNRVRSTAEIEANLELDAPAILRACRICLELDVKMYHITEYNLLQMYEIFTGKQLRPADRLPKTLCWECVGRLTSANKFRNKALKSYSLLHKNMNYTTYLSLRDVKSINRTRNHLTSTLAVDRPSQNVYIVSDDDVDVKSETDTERRESDFSDEDTNYIIPKEKTDDENVYLEEYVESMEDDDECLGGGTQEYEVTVVKREKHKIFFEDTGEEETLYIKEESEVVTDNNTSLNECTKPQKKTTEEVQRVVTPADIVEMYKNRPVLPSRTIGNLDVKLFKVTNPTYEEQIAELKKRQSTIAYRNAPHKCPACYRAYRDEQAYDKHVAIHDEKFGAYECFVCNLRYKTSGMFRNHLRSKHSEKISCRKCNFVTNDRCIAKRHAQYHAGVEYRCPRCPRVFRKQGSYFAHWRLRHVSKFVCELCGYTFVNEKGVRAHKNINHRLLDKNVALEGPHCADCDVRFLNDEAHTRHLKLSAVHTHDKDPTRIRNESSRKYNVAKVAATPSQPEPVTCEQCGLVVSNYKLYAIHFTVKHSDKTRTQYPHARTPFMCELCGKTFLSIHKFNDHKNVHNTSQNMYKCDLCEKRFSSKFLLYGHRRIHDPTRPTYGCSECGKRFTLRNNRDRHQIIHTGLKAFKCDVCGKAFGTQGERHNHNLYVHLKKPWPTKKPKIRPKNVVGHK